MWGAYHSVLLLIERRLGIGRDLEKPGGIVGQGRTILLVVLGWVFFRSVDVEYAIGYFEALFRPAGPVLPEVTAAPGTMGLAALLIGMASVALPRDWVTGVVLERSDTRVAGMLRAVTVGVALPVALILLVSGSFSPFLYFRF